MHIPIREVRPRGRDRANMKIQPRGVAVARSKDRGTGAANWVSGFARVCRYDAEKFIKFRGRAFPFAW